MATRLTESGQTMTITINHNSSTALEQSYINYWGGRLGGWGGLKPVIRSSNPRPRFCFFDKHSRHSSLVDDFKPLNASKQQIFQSRFNTEMIKDEYLTTRPIPKCWSNRSPTIEPWRAQPKTEHQAPTNLIENLEVFSFALKQVCQIEKEKWFVVKHETRQKLGIPII